MLVLHVELDDALVGVGLRRPGEVVAGRGGRAAGFDGGDGGVGFADVDGQEGVLGVGGVAVDDDGDGGVVVFYSGEVLLPEFPVGKVSSVLGVMFHRGGRRRTWRPCGHPLDFGQSRDGL